MRAYKLSWTLYIIGSLLVFGSWMNLVPTWLGWCGWLIALFAWGVGSKQAAPVVDKAAQFRSRADEFAKLDLLR